MKLLWLAVSYNCCVARRHKNEGKIITAKRTNTTANTLDWGDATTVRTKPEGGHAFQYHSSLSTASSRSCLHASVPIACEDQVMLDFSPFGSTFSFTGPKTVGP